jgi:hypothetical protein
MVFTTLLQMQLQEYGHWALVSSPQHNHLWVDRKMLACWSSGVALWIL